MSESRYVWPVDRPAIDADWLDSTDATRKGRLRLYAADFGGTDREFLRGWSDGTNARVALAAPASAPTDANLAASQVSAILDESGHTLNFRVRYSDGTTLKSGSVALT